MLFHLSRLVIWPRDKSKSPRAIIFSEVGINLVAGASRSGKSAIIKIVDYCLGSGSCKIPKLGPIRRSSAWYGIVVHTQEGYKLLARQDPGDQESTDEYMLIESLTPIIPDRPKRNTNCDAIKGLLARLSQLPQTNSDFAQSGSGYKRRASFGDMTAFLFQPQPIVAHDNILFYETDDEDHAKKLREIFPLVLGAVDAEMLVRQHRLAEVRRQLEKLRRQLQALRGSVSDYAGQVRGRFLAAVELGLIQADVLAIDDASLTVLLTRLRELVESWESEARGETPPVPTANAQRIATLRDRESEVSAQLASLKMRLVQLRELSHARQVSESTIGRERDRLAPASWLDQSLAERATCPFCGSDNHEASRELVRVRERVAEVEALWHGMARIPPMLDAEEVEVRRAITGYAEDLRQLRAESDQLEQRTPDHRKLEDRRAMFIGGLAEFLAVQRALAGDTYLVREIRALEEEERELQGLVDSATIEQRKEDALLLVSRYAQHYGRIVDLEDNNAVIKLDTKALTIRVISERGESAWLHQIGSGANHLGYHVAMLLALHEFFIQRRIPYVPSLLILDQPSQTQFPDDMDEEAEQEELLAVHKAFEAFENAIDRTDGQLQVIVSEHASKTVSEGIRHLTLVERWRWGRKLIPWHWDAESLAGLRGTRADFALEDLMHPIVIPALTRALGLQPAAVDRVFIPLVSGSFACA